MAPMQTLGLSESTPRTEGRLKSLFWPDIQNSSDVDYLGTQGFWVCVAVAIFSFAVSAFVGQIVSGTVVLLFYYLSGVGVRERSRFAAVMALAMYVSELIVVRPGVIRVAVVAVLFSNLRATWIAAQWKANSQETDWPSRLDETWGDKFSDKWPVWLWPKVRVIYYVFSICLLLLTLVGVAVILQRHGQANPL